MRPEVLKWAVYDAVVQILLRRAITEILRQAIQKMAERN